MNLKSIAIASAVGSLLALGITTASAADNAGKEKCAGIAEAGKNDCANKAHACAGQSKVSNDPNDWKYTPKGQCEKMGGKVVAEKPKAM